jgi:hypothetical protein
MAAETPLDLVFAGAKLSTAPTNILTPNTYPWGGTALGLVKNVVVKAGRRVSTFREEPYGPMPYDGIDLGEAWVMTGSFRTYDPDVISLVFASTGTGASTGSKQIVYPNGNTYRTGGLLSALGVKLLLTPDDFERQRFFYAYNAVPLTAEDGDMPFQRGEEWVVPFRFLCLPNGSNKTVAYGLREDLQTIL